MCDYSIEFYRSRPARAGEKYVLTRFRSGSIGFASPGDCATAVCMPYETRLHLEGISAEQQRRFAVAAEEQATFVQTDYGRYRDGIRFDNGIEVSLQQLAPGITAAISATAGIPMAVPRSVPAARQPSRPEPEPAPEGVARRFGLRLLERVF